MFLLLIIPRNQTVVLYLQDLINKKIEVVTHITTILLKIVEMCLWGQAEAKQAIFDIR